MPIENPQPLADAELEMAAQIQASTSLSGIAVWRDWAVTFTENAHDLVTEVRKQLEPEILARIAAAEKAAQIAALRDARIAVIEEHLDCYGSSYVDEQDAVYDRAIEDAARAIQTLITEAEK